MMSLADTLSHARAGDSSAFADLVRRFQDMAVGYAFALLGDHHLAEDAAQDAFLVCHQRLEQLRDPAAFAGWFRTIVRNTCEQSRRQRSRDESLDEAALEVGPTQQQSLEWDERRQEVVAEVASLPQQERDAISLFYTGSCSHLQIAQFLGVDKTTVNNRLRAARGRLKHRLVCPVRRTLRGRAPSRSTRFLQGVQRMLQPEEMKVDRPIELVPGVDSTTTEVWAMLAASRDGDLDVMKELASRQPALIRCEYNYTPPIHFAVREGHAHILSWLIEQGVDLAYRSYSFKDSLLQMAREREHHELIPMLEEAQQVQLATSGIDELLIAAGAGDVDLVASLLVDTPALIKACNDTGDTALHAACYGKHLATARLLLDRGADINAVRADGLAPIHSALERHHHELSSSLAVAGYLLGRGTTYNIFLAATFSDRAAVRAFLTADPQLANFQDSHGGRPLSAAAFREDLEMMQLLLEHGADPSLGDRGAPRGVSLWHAARVGNHEMATLLLEHGADPNGNAESGGKVIDRARKHPAIYDLLVTHGAQEILSPQEQVHNAIVDDDGDEVERLLSEHPHVAKDPEMFWGEGIMVMAARDGKMEMLKRLLKHGAAVPDTSKWGASYYFRELGVGRYLLENGMSPGHQNWHRTTLLHDMTRRSLTDKAALLLEHGAQIDALDDEYRSTPLGLAAREGQQEMVRWLIERGADVNKAGAPWATPVAWARKGGHESIVQILVDAGAL
ncbi:MAG: sigma-70 family RNA polymerase sigma factor [Gemmatimonadetes bacterium]|jgi:RNA polymerase sigma factor (sigma-70 family)|nr:sigma-70 family RNA polymerase sigma factor [Gemmatimonadota bacterium]MBT4610576.1 sigma-70 family RNA polymerase sigma factor [Gemmatimonadota bacterium]MBT5141312.1 sigma-70 family RNA polymerase sigma factor [Gemmatimonadota bacterium]MBT5590393.1 sigma-70 family RNA polymerase sigma factor [Gemmatimonadota bacterium]MBT5964230.1 sigma-70 family RNA polymerase sigma factor [Gemmatimonadota bacterium]